MCGIVGRVAFDGRPEPPGWLRSACSLLRHRGPDDEAVTLLDEPGRPRVAFGHRRLRVIDLSDAANQPMSNSACVEAGRASPLVIVFNGEIYNYRELRATLIERGHRFGTVSDTEVILHLYEDHGPDAVHWLKGMFAFAIWDARTATLFCARDRLGKKPFYYRHDRSTFWFASEARALLADPDVPIEIAPGAIASYLALGYVPGPASAFASLSRLRPGHRLRVSAEGLVIDRYWRLAFEPKLPLSEREAVAALKERLFASVRRRLVSDVPLGALLSGGVDSSLVVGLMAKASDRPVRTFSIGFGDGQYNELPAARRVAARFRTEHHEFVVQPDATSVLPALARSLGEPFADSSALPTYHVAELARRSVTVALNGDGGDEGFGGYRRYVAYRALKRWDHAPVPLRHLVAAAASWLPAAATSRSWLYDLGRVLAGTAQPPARRYAGWFGFFPDPQAMLHPQTVPVAWREAIAPLEAAFRDGEVPDAADAAMAADIALYLPDDLLVKVDIASMAHGLEVRSPLLDHELLEFGARLPVTLKVRGTRGKRLLKAAVADLVPDEVLSKTKTGFGVPVDRWLREDLREFARETLLSRRAAARGFVDVKAVERLLDEHRRGRAHGQRLWALLMLELWFTECVEAPRAGIGEHAPAAGAGAG